MSEETFDFIVVGAGSAGCALAARLSEDPGTRVLLLEAGGPDRNIWLHIPIGYYRTIFHPDLGWGYATEPEPGLDGRRIFWPRGKVLGGSSSINGLVYIRGQRQDFDHWRQLGNPGWSFGDVLPYFKRAEDQARGADAFHGAGGPLGVTDSARHELIDAYIKACAEIGIPENDDFNGAVQEGAGYFQLTNRKGFRCSSAKAYLKPARGRPNLKVETRALAERILFEGRRATGVVFRQEGTERRVLARREIVLAGGAINSPQLLQLSGVGPADHLRAHGIAVVHELKGVGGNLQDHFQARSVYRCTRPITLNDRVKSPFQKVLMGLEWFVRRSGPLTVGAGQGCIFARTRLELASPDIQFHIILFSADRPGEPLHTFSGFTASVCQLRPESRGTVMITSADPAAKPAIRANYLATETDRRTMVDGMRMARRLAGTEALRPYIAEEVEPGPSVRGDEAMLAYCRARGGTIFHPTSTCKMGPASDPLAVVDHELRVHGLDGLRVADASIMPTVVSGNTNAACIMIGEKAADMILGRPALASEDPLPAAAARVAGVNPLLAGELR
jgi:choline dehydrogenase